MPSRHKQRGAAALVVTLGLLLVLALVVGYANRSLLVEQRAAANLARSTQAFEAAEAGLEWALALLNSGEPLGADCEPSSGAGSATFRERYLAWDAASGAFQPRTWADAGASVALQAACVRIDAGWSCSCPASGRPVLPAPAGSSPQAAFSVQFVAAGRSGMVHVLASGCSHIGSACVAGSAASGGSTARLQQTLGLLPALATVPVAPLTARGSVAATGALGASNTAARDGGVTVAAGGAIALPAAHLATLAGSTPGASLQASDAALAVLDSDRMFATFLGLDRARWQQRTATRTISCPGACAEALAQALGDTIARPLVWVTNDLHLDGPVTFGSPENPVLLVVEGQLQLGAGVVIHGLVYSLAAQTDTSGLHGVTIHGALVAAGNVIGDGTPELIYDAGALARLHGSAGSFTRVPGSWRDY